MVNSHSYLAKDIEKTETAQIPNQSRPQTKASSRSRLSNRSRPLTGRDPEKSSMNQYIQELEEQLKEEKLKRIKSEAILKEYISKKTPR